MNTESVPVEARLVGLSSQLVPELRSYLQLHRREVKETVCAGGPAAGLAAGYGYARAIDGLLSGLFLATRAALGRMEPLSLAGVGSYGRRTLCLHSDVDVRLIASGSVESARALAEALLYPLWDAGLDMGHQVITVDETLELALGDLPTATSLLDFRRISGDAALAQRLIEGAFAGPFGSGHLRSFLRALEESAEQRHERFGGSVFLLEPDVKNGTGGLRDLDVARWAIRARFRVNDFESMTKVGVLTKAEWRDLERAYRFLAKVRARLHLNSGRRADRLIFDAQERVALDLGYPSGATGVEAFMSDYYRHARAIDRSCRMSIARAQPPGSVMPTQVLLGDGLARIGERLAIAHTGQLRKNPALAVRVYRKAAEEGLKVDDATRQAIARACASKTFPSKLRESREAAEAFVRLVRLVRTVPFPGGSILRELHEVGLLLAMIPEFAPVVGRAHHDIYHVYTVDVHSVAAVDRLRALCRGDLATDQALACRLAAEISRPNVLFFATLLHDIGKDEGGRAHSERGAYMAPAILRRLGFEEADIAEIQHLIRKHLRMYHVATRRDIDDPRTMQEFSEEVNGAEGLCELYLLTVADVSTTSPTALTAWKGRMLAELYVATQRWLEEGNRQGSAFQERARQQVLSRFSSTSELESGRQRPPSSEIEVMLDALPERFLNANDAAAASRQLAAAWRGRERLAHVEAIEENSPYVELCVVAKDSPGLLSAIAATLSAAKMKVLGSQVYSFRQGDETRALDMFWVRSGQLTANVVRAVSKLERTLTDILSGRVDAEQLVRSHSGDVKWTTRVTPPVETEVTIDSRSGSRHTLVEVITQDRRDLLFWLSKTLHQAGATIDLAKINTEGERVADVFYVSNERGEKLDPEHVVRVQERLEAVLASIEQELS